MVSAMFDQARFGSMLTLSWSGGLGSVQFGLSCITNYMSSG